MRWMRSRKNECTKVTRLSEVKMAWIRAVQYLYVMENNIISLFDACAVNEGDLTVRNTPVRCKSSHHINTDDWTNI